MKDSFGSFCVDHTKLVPGIYVSRKDSVDGGNVWTIDIRVTTPYKDPTLTKMENHSVEHIIATHLESICTAKIKKIYFGPMGCATGFYALFYVPADLEAVAPRLILSLLHNAFDHYVTEVPFNSEIECGNCKTLAIDEEDIKRINDLLGDIDVLINKCLVDGKFDDYPYIQ